MKECLDCGKHFDDSYTRCPDCKTLLIEMWTEKSTSDSELPRGDKGVDRSKTYNDDHSVRRSSTHDASQTTTTYAPVTKTNQKTTQKTSQKAKVIAGDGSPVTIIEQDSRSSLGIMGIIAIVAMLVIAIIAIITVNGSTPPKPEPLPIMTPNPLPTAAPVIEPSPHQNTPADSNQPQTVAPYQEPTAWPSRNNASQTADAPGKEPLNHRQPKPVATAVPRNQVEQKQTSSNPPVQPPARPLDTKIALFILTGGEDYPAAQAAVEDALVASFGAQGVSLIMADQQRDMYSSAVSNGAGKIVTAQLSLTPADSETIGGIVVPYCHANVSLRVFDAQRRTILGSASGKALRGSGQGGLPKAAADAATEATETAVAGLGGVWGK